MVYTTPFTEPCRHALPDHRPAPALRSGTIKWKQQLFVSRALANEQVGLEEAADGVWDLYFYDRLLARLDERSGLRP